MKAMKNLITFFLTTLMIFGIGEVWGQGSIVPRKPIAVSQNAGGSLCQGFYISDNGVLSIPYNVVTYRNDFEVENILGGPLAVRIFLQISTNGQMIHSKVFEFFYVSTLNTGRICECEENFMEFWGAYNLNYNLSDLPELAELQCEDLSLLEYNVYAEIGFGFGGANGNQMSFVAINPADYSNCASENVIWPYDQCINDLSGYDQITQGGCCSNEESGFRNSTEKSKAKIISSSYFSLDGKAIDNLNGYFGIYLKRDQLDNGSIRTKTYIKFD